MSLPYFNYYPADFETDTSCFSLEEIGAFQRLLNQLWIKGIECKLPNDDTLVARLLRITLVDWQRLKEPLLNGPFAVLRIDKEGRIYSRRLCEEYAKAVDKSTKARESAEKRWGASEMPTHMRSDMPTHMLEPMRMHMLTQDSRLIDSESQDSSPPIVPPKGGSVSVAEENFQDFFSEFMEHYPPDRDGKKPGGIKIERKARAILVRDRDDVLLATKHYAQTDKVIRGFVKAPDSFLTADWWRAYVTPPEPQRDGSNGAHRQGTGEGARPAQAGEPNEHQRKRAEGLRSLVAGNASEPRAP